MSAKKLALLLLLIAGCKRTPATPDASPTPIASPSVTATASASAPPPVPDTRTPVHVVADRWNDAHNKRDVKELEAVYATSVDFYGQTLSGAECAKRKMAALAKSPKYRQAIHSWMYGQAETADGQGATGVIFTKTTTENGKSTDYIQLLTIDKTLKITREIDRTSEQNLAKASWPWCMDGYNESNDKVRPPFKISSNEAIARFARSKHLASINASAPSGHGYGGDGFDCTVPCDTTQPRSCGYNIRVVDAGATTISRLVEWVYVDGITGVLWYPDPNPEAGLDAWLSETP